jgi:pyruvate/2-oxoglutarate dehydrogenase complex dihydrolipoamide dehydrogenase (E3) component
VSPAAIAVDVAAIGTGQAVPALATALAARGESVVVFEQGRLGGSCVNVGCTPTKALRKSARVAQLARRAAEFGVRTGPVEVDVPAALARARGIATASREGLERWLHGTAGLTVVPARAMLDGRSGDRVVVRAGGGTWYARRVLLNTGTRPLLPPVPGLAEAAPLTNESIFDLAEAPRRLVIIGGSYIGLEFAQCFRRFGVAVTVLEGAPTIAAREDADLVEALTALLTDEGITIHAGVAIAAVERDGEGAVQVRLADGRRITGSHLLVATGRRPNTDALGLETVGITPDARGFIPVDGTLATQVPGVWALGDINGRGAFTHTAWQDHEIVLATLTGTPRTAEGRITTYAMFTDPPLARIGLSERDARQAMAEGRRFLMATHRMAQVSRAKEEGETAGLIKLLVDADTRQFAGIGMLGFGADEVVQVVGAQMAAGAPFDVLRDALPVHPTVTEFFPTILGRLAPLGG